MLIFNDYEEDAASVDSVVDEGGPFVNGRKEIRMMADFKKRSFLYAKNGTDLSALMHLVELNGDYIQGGYDFIEEPGECDKLFDMLELVISGDKIYVPSIRVFQYSSVEKFKETYTSINCDGIYFQTFTEREDEMVGDYRRYCACRTVYFRRLGRQNCVACIPA